MGVIWGLIRQSSRAIRHGACGGVTVVLWFCLRKEPFSYLCLQIASKLLPCLNQMVLASGLPFHDFVLGLMLHMFIGMWSFMYEEARVMYIVYEVHFNWRNKLSIHPCIHLSTFLPSFVRSLIPSPYLLSFLPSLHSSIHLPIHLYFSNHYLIASGLNKIHFGEITLKTWTFCGNFAMLTNCIKNYVKAKLR